MGGSTLDIRQTHSVGCPHAPTFWAHLLFHPGFMGASTGGLMIPKVMLSNFSNENSVGNVTKSNRCIELKLILKRT